MYVCMWVYTIQYLASIQYTFTTHSGNGCYMLLHIGTCTIYAKVTLLLFIVAMVTVFSDEIGRVAALVLVHVGNGWCYDTIGRILGR